jgi:hypothetical protein
MDASGMVVQFAATFQKPTPSFGKLRLSGTVNVIKRTVDYFVARGFS